MAAFAESGLSEAAQVGFPWRAASRCLELARVSPENVQAVALGHDPSLHLGRVLRNALAHAPAGFARFADDAVRWLPPPGMPALLRARLGYRGRVLYVERLEALGRAALADSMPEPCALVVAAGRGEAADAALGAADGSAFSLLRRLPFPHGLGPLWSAFAHYLGAREDAWRQLPELAASGSPRFSAKMLERLVDLKRDGSLRLDLGYFGFGAGLEPTNPRFWALFGRPPRQPDQKPDAWAADVAASLQAVTVETLRRMAEEARAVTGFEDVCLAGDAARNEPALEALRAAFRGHVRAGSAPAPLAGAVGAAAAAWERGLRRGRPALPPAAWASPPLGGAPAAEGFARPALRRLGALCALALAGAAVPLRSDPWLSGLALGLAGVCALGAWLAPETLGELTAAGALAAAYYAALTPASLIARTLGFEPLPERWRARGSYWSRS